jgi:hypothetical protein
MTIPTYTLLDAERDLRNVYWHIRTSRGTSWKHVNQARAIKEIMRKMGVRRHEIIDATYCLRNINCNRCSKNKLGIACYEISKRRLQAL